MSAVMDETSWSSRDCVIYSEIGNDIALLDTERNVYYSLTGIGPFLWTRLIDGSNFRDLCDAVTAAFEVDAATVRQDVFDWLHKMADAGLVVETGQ